MSRGELYKPDSMSFGGGCGNGRDFEMDDFRANPAEDASDGETPASPDGKPDGADFGDSTRQPSGDFAPFDANASDSAENRPSGPDAGGFNFGMGSDDVKLIYSDDDPESYANIFDNAKTNLTKRDKERLIESLRKLNAQEDLEHTVDADEVIRYLAVHNFLCNDDSYTGMMVHNYYLYEEDGQLSIIPWDYNLAFGGFSAASNATSTVNSAIDSPVSGGTIDSRPLIAWIFSDEDALAQYHEIYDAFLSENLESGWLEAEIARVQELITPYLEQDESKFYDMDAFQRAVDTLQIFCVRRGESVRGQLSSEIASTTAERQRSSVHLVDASDISTEDMGSMNTSQGGGPGMGNPLPKNAADGSAPGQPTPPDGAATNAADVSNPEPPTPPDGATSNGVSFGGSGGEVADATEAPDSAETDNFTHPEELPGGFPEEQNRSAQWGSLAIWTLILLFGLFVVKHASSHN